MRIVHILNHVREIGNGIVNVAIDLACLQAKSGNKVAVISGGGEYETLLKSFGVSCYRLNQGRTPANMLKAAITYREIIEEFQPNIVHAHMMTGVVLASLLRFGYDYELVSTVHNEFQRSAILMGLADRVIAVSQAVAVSMEKRGIPKHKLQVISNGILGTPRFVPSDCIPEPLQHPAIATVSGIYKRKGIGELLAAFEQISGEFPQAHLYIVGDGPDREYFEAQAKASAAADRIHFEGFQRQPQRYLLSCDIFVMASYHESFGLAIAEARETGCAIIASNVDGIAQTLDGGKAGILVPPKNSQAIASAMSELLSYPDTLQEWKLRAGENLEWLSVNRVHQETLALYRELITNFKEKVSSISPTDIKTTLPNQNQGNRAA
ncbi:glycosyltransferase family 4 protein [Calothrix sp. UHCC 0171]|uniref:glycosyltransferase family 4 protein n=1 Tax=Calothrix sp. UHCC 0171 TaxID=3110245 RepID=UPI002B21EF38|nr:glycosyltransferase family 4 protein [Calothrix sp. UHCC 0171]MEA5569755.1 glycosyltransferase family 4 protein [Calothrix sp. UHCC 0171]